MQIGQIEEILFFQTIVMRVFGHIYNLDIQQIILLLMLRICVIKKGDEEMGGEYK